MTTGRAWLALFRPPNFLTVPGDVLGGFLLAAGAGAAWGEPGLWGLVVAALLFYAVGLLLNDWADAQVDAAERPDRPIPSGAVSRRSVIAVAGILVFLAIGLCLTQGELVTWVGLALAVAIANYNLLAKKLPLVGPVNMGVCRGLSFFLGAALIAPAMWSSLVWWGGATLTGYIAAVTHLARREMSGRYFLLERWLPALVLVGSFFVYVPLSRLIDWPAQVVVALSFVFGVGGAAKVAGLLPGRQTSESARPIPTPALIGRLIGLLLPLQAAFIAGSGDGLAPMVLALTILGLWPIKRWMGKVFYSS